MRLYCPSGAELGMLAILTNDDPVGINAPGRPRRVAIYLPMSYNMGGYTIYVPPEQLQEIDLPVEHVLKLAATAHIGARSDGVPMVTAEEVVSGK